jgi:hypothetical protein
VWPPNVRTLQPTGKRRRLHVSPGWCSGWGSRGSRASLHQGVLVLDQVRGPLFCSDGQLSGDELLHTERTPLPDLQASDKLFCRRQLSGDELFMERTPLHCVQSWPRLLRSSPYCRSYPPIEITLGLQEYSSARGESTDCFNDAAYGLASLWVDETA